MNTDDLPLTYTNQLNWKKERNLQTALQICNVQLKYERDRFQKLKKDFLYNLSINNCVIIKYMDRYSLDGS